MIWEVMDGHNKKGIEAASNKNMVIWALWNLFWKESHIMYNSPLPWEMTQLAYFVKTQYNQLAFLQVLGAQRASSGRQSWYPLLKSP